MFPQLLPPTDHAPTAVTDIKYTELTFPQMEVKSLKTNSLTNLSLERNSVLLITLACLYMCNMLPTKVSFLDKHTARLMKY